MLVKNAYVLCKRGIVATEVNGGVTLSVATLEPIAWKHGYTVATESLYVTPFDSLRNDSRELATLVSSLRHKLDSFPGASSIGFWLDEKTGLLHIDIVEYHADALSAVETAIRFNQIAIWANGQSREIRLSDISPIAPDDRTKNGKGIRTANGVQPWSVGDIYPLIVSSRGSESSGGGSWYVWCGSTGIVLREFAFGRQLQWVAHRTEDEQRIRCFDYAKTLATTLREATLCPAE